MGTRFRNLFGLEISLKQEVEHLNRAQREAMAEVERLQSACMQPPPGFVALAAQCGR